MAISFVYLPNLLLSGDDQRDNYRSPKTTGGAAQMGRLYSVAGVKEYLDISRSQVYEYIKDGLNPTHRLGKSPRWTEDAILAWLKTKEITQH